MQRGASRHAGQVKLVVFVPESDLGRVSDAVFAAGAGRIGEYRECSFRLAGTEFMSQRLVHLVDASKRNELMIIYVEDLSDTGFTAANLSEGGSAHARWNEISQGLLDRALKNMKVSK